MYVVISEGADAIVTQRRKSFQLARKAANAHGWATWQDALGIEASIHFRKVRGRVVMCHCSAEVRLMRAIFGEDHPDICTVAAI